MASKEKCVADVLGYEQRFTLLVINDSQGTELGVVENLYNVL